MPTLKKPLVSSIIIFLNGDSFIVEAIDSVFVQTYDNWELLLVDDGSMDNSRVGCASRTINNASSWNDFNLCTNL